MSRTFKYTFNPSQLAPVPGPTVDLTVNEIEDAGVREVLQTPGAALGSWTILDSLLQPTGTGSPFVFREPLGQAREVKVALSGLFGRFVARAYLEHYHGLTIYAHVGLSGFVLNRRQQIRVKRRAKGDLPDWLTCKTDLSSLTVAEAKGCHDKTGTAQTLARGWEQAKRIRVTVQGQRVTLKRFAIATRWASARGGADEALLSVHDPDEKGVRTSQEAEDALYVGVFRLHLANLLAPLGHRGFARTLRDLVAAKSDGSEREAQIRARQSLDIPRVRANGVQANDETLEDLVGGTVTRSGPISTTLIPSKSDQDALMRLNQRPVFVGIAHSVLKAAVDGEASVIRQELERIPIYSRFARTNRAGGWIVPLGGDSGEIEKS